MLTKNTISHINQLKLRKSREQFGEFIAEGPKLVSELLESGYKVNSLFATSEWGYNNKSKYTSKVNEIVTVSEKEMERISLLKTVSDVLAIVSIPSITFSEDNIKNELSLVLDTIQDPGNLGTIIRTADWFGLKTIFCSKNTVDVFNPKVVQATMGSITRVNVFYIDIVDLLKSMSNEVHLPVYGTYLSGKNIFEHELSKNGLIIMGSEGSGISNALAPYIKEKLFIPSFQNQGHSSESLNVSVATAIVCSEFKRRI